MMFYGFHSTHAHKEDVLVSLFKKHKNDKDPPKEVADTLYDHICEEFYFSAYWEGQNLGNQVISNTKKRKITDILYGEPSPSDVLVRFSKHLHYTGYRDPELPALPDEIWNTIFECIGMQELCDSGVYKVCKRWYRIMRRTCKSLILKNVVDDTCVLEYITAELSPNKSGITHFEFSFSYGDSITEDSRTWWYSGPRSGTVLLQFESQIASQHASSGFGGGTTRLCPKNPREFFLTLLKEDFVTYKIGANRFPEFMLGKTESQNHFGGGVISMDPKEFKKRVKSLLLHKFKPTCKLSTI
jgi:hypothetical protein